jgi:DNA helicase-2/ATP-dependent DNA helicase PcrA
LQNNDPLLRELNPPQRQAVTHGDGPLLVLAGAGSGKTRVLTHRIAWLVERRGVDPRRILAVTFTNKAARQMADRVGELLGGVRTGAWIGTFHAIALRILRSHGDLLEVGRGFAVYDADDQLRLAKRVVKALGLDPKRYKPSALLGAVQRAKDDGLGPEEFAQEGANTYTQALYGFYKRYQLELTQAGAMDFGDLMVQTLALFSRHPEVADNYAQRFQHVLVDEYQDTNRVQHLIARRISSKWRNLFVVGDDDQSIYAWRGADIRNILQFKEQQPDAEVIKLEQNYRSTGPILEAASAVIDHNKGRHGKTLWTERPEGAGVVVHAAGTEEEESAWIVQKIKTLRRGGLALSDIGILYRTHALSRPLEAAFFSAKIPYVIYGGLRFYERREVKDVLAFLRLAVNPSDPIALLRGINLPTRGIGTKTVEKIFETSRDNAARGIGGGLWGAARTLAEEGALGPRGSRAVAGFVNMVEGWREALKNEPLPAVLTRILDETGYRAYLEKQEDERTIERLENIEELMSDAEGFESERGAADADVDSDANSDVEADVAVDPVSALLDRAALVSEQDRSGQERPVAVTLMTIHSAKGLEYPVVFVTGLEEGVFPHSRSLDEDEGVEEERRLCYVAITRAKDQLYLTRSRVRRVYGADSMYRAESRFLQELPEHMRPRDYHFGDTSLYEAVRQAKLTGGYSEDKPGQAALEQPAHSLDGQTMDEQGHDEQGPADVDGGGSYYLPDPGEAHYTVGMMVRHARYGVGRVSLVEGRGAHAKVAVDFERTARKKFIAGMASLEIQLDT